MSEIQMRERNALMDLIQSTTMKATTREERIAAINAAVRVAGEIARDIDIDEKSIGAAISS